MDANPIVRRPGRVGVLISGRGSNLQALLDAVRAGRLGGEIVVVISNVPGAPGLERARAVDLVCLAGFMRRLSPGFVAAFRGRLLNVHPSLLPAFPGTQAQRQALEYGAKLSGATVHLVDEGLDSGPILLQEAVLVREDDTPESLASRILEAEHRLYPRAVRLMLEGRCRVDGRRVRITDAA